MAALNVLDYEDSLTFVANRNKENEVGALTLQTHTCGCCACTYAYTPQACLRTCTYARTHLRSSFCTHLPQENINLSSPLPPFPFSLFVSQPMCLCTRTRIPCMKQSWQRQSDTDLLRLTGGEEQTRVVEE